MSTHHAYLWRSGPRVFMKRNRADGRARRATHFENCRRVVVLVGAMACSACGHSQTPPSPNATLPPEVVRRHVRSHNRAYQRCYEDGLRRDPTLQGTVVVRLAIGADGSVLEAAKETGTTLADTVVIDCVLSEFKTMTFPRPEDGIATAFYPMVFSAPGFSSPEAREAEARSASHRKEAIDYSALPNRPEYPCEPTDSPDAGAANTGTCAFRRLKVGASR